LCSSVWSLDNEMSSNCEIILEFVSIEPSTRDHFDRCLLLQIFSQMKQFCFQLNVCDLDRVHFGGYMTSEDSVGS